MREPGNFNSLLLRAKFDSRLSRLGYLNLEPQKGILLKHLRLSIAVLAFWVTGLAQANESGAAACVPYKIAIAESIAACDNGLIGSKFRTKEKVCPSGAITESREFDTSGCTAPPPAAGTVNSATRCIVTPGACAPVINPANCPPDSRWTLQGSNIAHCVQNDPVCPWGTSLKHDFLGNPSCEANTCPSGQVLQGDGKSCACPGATVWNGATCVAATPTCTAGAAYRYRTCPVGYDGYLEQMRETTCPAGPYGSPSYSAWQTVDDACYSSAPPPPPEPPSQTCAAGTETEWSMCTYGGAMWRYHTTSCPGGTYGSPSTSTSDWDTSLCESAPSGPAPAPDPTPAPEPAQTPTPTPEAPPSCSDTTNTSNSSCGSGYSGEKSTTSYYNCTTQQTTYSTDDSGCGCANGASDYPSCTPPPPVAVTCGPWKKTGPFGKGICYSETMDWIETYERSCSDGSVETQSQEVNSGPCY